MGMDIQSRLRQAADRCRDVNLQALLREAAEEMPEPPPEQQPVVCVPEENNDEIIDVEESEQSNMT